MTLAAGFPENFQNAFAKGAPYFRIRGNYLSTDVFVLNKAGDHSLIPWGLIVGPDSDIDTFVYQDPVISGVITQAFSWERPLLDIQTPGDNDPSMARQIFIGRDYQVAGSPRVQSTNIGGGVGPFTDLYVLFRPPVTQISMAGPRAPVETSRSEFAYTAANGALLPLGAVYSASFGRTSCVLSAAVSSAATVRFDVYGLIQPAGLTAYSPLLFSYTTTGTGSDTVSTIFDLPSNIAGIAPVITKTAGGVGGTASMETWVQD